MISSCACQGLRFSYYVHLGKNKLQVNCSIKTCYSVLFSRIHNWITKSGGRRDKQGSSLTSRKITGDFSHLSESGELPGFPLKGYSNAATFTVRTFFLIFTLTLLPCAPLNVKEKGCGGRFIWEQNASHVTHLFYGASFWVQQHSWSSSLDLHTNFLSAPSLLSLETCRASAIIKESLGPGICNPLLSGTLYLVRFKWC